jgi:hypothetical protein
MLDAVLLYDLNIDIKLKDINILRFKGVCSEWSIVL